MNNQVFWMVLTFASEAFCLMSSWRRRCLDKELAVAKEQIERILKDNREMSAALEKGRDRYQLETWQKFHDYAQPIPNPYLIQEPQN